MRPWGPFTLVIRPTIASGKARVVRYSDTAEG
jgi:hypothetical protein